MPRRVLRSTLLCALLAAPVTVGAAPEFVASRSWDALRTQVDFGPRVPGSTGHQACLDWMRQELGRLADEVEVHSFEMDDPYGDGTLSLTNLRASFRPAAALRLAIAAHWDTRPRADQDTVATDEPIPGANDGASGVAVLMEVARVLSEQGPPIGVDLLFFDGEDYGREGDPDHYLLGSRRFVADHPGFRPRALILLDMVGDADLSIPMEGYSLRNSPEWTRSVFGRARALGLSAFKPAPGPAVLDDHVPFLRQGIDSVDLIDFDYPQWHTHADDLDACSPASLHQVGRLLLSLIYDGLGY
jgi:hypothetical protein